MDIPQRALNIWETPLSIRTAGRQLEDHKLQCANCGEQLSDVDRFAVHLSPCMLKADRDSLEYVTHLHANRLVLMANEISKICGATTNVDCLVCPICKDAFDDEDDVKYHINTCWNYQMEMKDFLKKFNAVFQNLAESHERLGMCFQKYILNAHSVKISKCDQSEKASVSSGPKLSDVEEYFSSKDHLYKQSLKTLIEDVFLRYLTRRAQNPMIGRVGYGFPEDNVKVMMKSSEVTEVIRYRSDSGSEADDEHSDDSDEDMEIDVVN